MLSPPDISLETSPPKNIETKEALQQWASDHRIDEIECVTADFAGIARGKVMPASKFFKSEAVKLPTSIFFPTITGNYAEVDHDNYQIDSDLILIPDYKATHSVPWAGEPSLQIIHDVYEKNNKPALFAPRTVLKNVLELYRRKGLQPLVAPELEFYLTAPNKDANKPLVPPIGRSGRQSIGAQAYSITAVDEYEQVINYIYDYAEAQGIEIDTIIQEAGAAQLEINLLHGDPLLKADQVFVFKRTIKEAALRCNCYATFMAKPMENQPGSAMHIHQSIVDIKTGRNIFNDEDGKPTQEFNNFIGGHQKYFNAVMSLGAPYVNSYRRLVSGHSAPINLDWGVDNRTTGLRVPQSDPEARRVENRVIGADANPYLAMAACLAAGYLGLENSTSAKRKTVGDAYEKEHSLPYDLMEGVKLLDQSKEMRAVLGDQFVDYFVAVKQFEYQEFMHVISPWEREYLLLNV